MRSSRSSLGFLLVLVPSGCAPEAASDDDATDEQPAVTYFRDIKPLLDARCGACHVAGGVTPFPLEDYEDAVTYAAAAQAAIRAGTMPPWQPNGDCNQYVGQREITEDEIATIDAWIEAGTPEGDPADEPPPLEVEIQTLSRVDLTLRMPEPYTPQQSPDEYRCFVLDWPAEYDSTVYVTGKRIVPGNPALVHHVIAYVAPASARADYQALDEADPGPGYTCFGTAGGSLAGSIGGWTPGSFGADTPAGTGLPMEPGAMIVLQVHYNTLTEAPAPDQTSVEIKVDASVERPARMAPVVDPAWIVGGGMSIPAGEADVVHRATLDPQLYTDADEFTIHTAMLHMHLLGTRGRLTVVRSDGSEECVLQIDDWDFQWQDFYELRQPIQWRVGDTLGIECHYDNTAANQPVIDGQPIEPRDVEWGDGTTDEMCIGFMMISSDSGV